MPVSAAPSSGKYAVPAEIRALKPKNVSCLVKKIDDGYYVYEHLRVDDPKHPGKKKNATGRYLGVISDMKFHPAEGFSVEDTQGFISDISEEVPDLLEYGAYALPVSVSESVLERLQTVYSYDDATRIYVIALIYFVNHYTPARDLQECFRQSYLSKLYTRVSLSENAAGRFLEDLGSHAEKRLRFEQSLIRDGSGNYNIDGHVILCCSKYNDLAAYGSHYPELGSTQANFMMIFDAGNKRVISCNAFDGGIPDKAAVKDTLDSHEFRSARFRVDSGFYSEENMALFRENECSFVVPVPGTTVLKKTALKHIRFEKSFVHRRKGDNGKTEYSSVQYQEFTVQQLEDLAEQDAVEEAERRNSENEGKTDKDGKPLKKVYPKKIARSSYQKDRVIVYRDQLMYDRLVFDYRKTIGDGTHTEEKFAELEPQFGIILLRTNDLKKTAEQLYCEYKDRWQIETYYDYLANGIDCKALHSSNYYVQQGIGFLIMIEGLIYSEVFRHIEKSEKPYIRNMSIDECILTSRRLKTCRYPDNTWHVNQIRGEITKLFDYFGLDISADMHQLNLRTKVGC